MDHDDTSTSNDRSDQFGAYIAAKNAEIARLSMENTQLIKTCATRQREHADTMTKYRDTHQRYLDVVGKQAKLMDNLRDSEERHNKRLVEKRREICGLNQSLHNRIQEKDEAIRQIEYLTKENADLLKTHADLGEEIVALKKENADLVQTVYPLESKIKMLEAVAMTLKRASRSSAENNVKSGNEDSMHVPERDRSRQRSRSRSTNLGSSYGRETTHSEYNRRHQERSYSRDRSGYWRHDSLRRDSRDRYVPEYAQYAPYQGRDHSRLTVKSTDRLLTPRLSPNSSHRSPNNEHEVEVRENDASEGLNFALVPKGPKAGTTMRRKTSSKKKKKNLKRPENGLS